MASSSENNVNSDLSERMDGVSLNDGDVEMENTDLPSAIIIVNVADVVFESESEKSIFEEVFRQFDAGATFQYLKSFRRARCNYCSPIVAAKARIQLHETELCGNRIKCFFVQSPSEALRNSEPYLQLPPLEKQFLISPPASPPVGWEPVPEAEPIINYDLLNAVVRLAPGEKHELHPPVDNAPAIVVHICEDPEGYKDKPLVQTRRPNCGGP
ncbi:unnamed protein product [Owenia fusiformis]|uniref:Uncharacterized protein n=1 Tax=Owenia fusiformis TaxID=6347 RepID=A0A8J1TBS5_OWEFU|nr:unnamed protein product [Owenia fusiformis]